MISYGFCYVGENGNLGGYNPAGVGTKKEAEAYIKGKLAGHKVSFIKDDKKVRATSDGLKTGYIYFTVNEPVYIAVDTAIVSTQKIASGRLAEVKAKVRKYLDEQYNYGVIDKIKFKTNDEVLVGYCHSNSAYSTTGVYLFKA